jgi:glycosylphosphatidylinositol transamidase (GPIT) subunit GPI8
MVRGQLQMVVSKWSAGFLAFVLLVVIEANSNNWAVLVDTSKFWHNYRHSVNVLSVYHLVKKLGIPDSQVYSE